MRRSLAAALALLIVAAPARAQDSLDVTFRFIPDLAQPPISPVLRAFVPGAFNDWGQPYLPGSQSCIQAGDESQMSYHAPLAEYRHTTRLRVGGGGVPGGGYTYKVQYHRNSAGTDCVWLPDPLGTETFGPNNDTVVRVTNPMAFQLAREENAAGQVEAVSAGVFGTAAFTSIEFQVNGTTRTDGLSFYDAATGIFRYVLPAPVPRGSLFRIAATDALGRTVSAQVGIIPPVVTDAPVPAGLADGITYDPADPTRATLVLRAPGKAYVYLLGPFNGWQPTEAYLLRRDPAADGGMRWWIELTDLTPGTEIPFLYFVDGTIRVTDPYSEKVLFSGDAGYPGQANGYAVGLLQPGRPPFPWTDAGWVRPPQEDLVVYELLVRDFLAAHSFDVLADTLDYLVRLGVNAIELMPVSEYDGTESWGYNPAFHFAVDKYYGTQTDLKEFVDMAHARGLAVILDVVYNHATGQNPFVRLYNEGDYGPPTAQNPWFNVTATHPFSVFNDANHESPLTQDWLDRANRFWVEEFHVDGYRFDLSGGFMQSGPFLGYNPGRVAILERMMGALWTAHPDVYVILEHLVESGQEWRDLADFGEAQGWPGPVLWNNMSRPYSQSAMGYPTDNGALTATYAPSWAGGVPVEHAVAYMESHDEQWMMFKNRAYGNANPTTGYTVRSLHTALDRQKLAAAFFFTVPGPRMLWQFGEQGYGWGPHECLVNGDYPGECQSGVPGRVDRKPIRWDYYADGVNPYFPPQVLPVTPPAERALRRKLYGTFAALINLRQDYAIFRDPATQVTMQVGNVPGRWIRLSNPGVPAGEPSQVVIVGNFGVGATTVTPTFPAAGTWHDFFYDTELTVTDPGMALTLQAGEFHLYTDVDVPSPEPGLITVDGEEGPAGPSAFALDAPAPNPAGGLTTVRFALDAPGEARLEAFDVLGRRVATLHDGPLPAGAHAATLDAAGLPAGVYVLRLAADGRTATARLTVAR